MQRRSGFRVQGAGCRGQGSEFRVQGSGDGVQCSRCRVQGAGRGTLLVAPPPAELAVAMLVRLP